MYRSIDTEIWNDGWFQEELNRDQKLLFLFLITNQRTTTAGAFEITLSSLSTETGIPRDDLNGLLASLAPKVVWWPEHRIVWVRNFHRRQFPNASDKIITNARNALERMPVEVRDTVYREYPHLGTASEGSPIPPAYPIEGVSIGHPLVEEEKRRGTDTAPEREPAEELRASAPAPAADPLVDAVVDVLVDAAFVNDASDAVRAAVSRAYQLVPDFNRRDGPLEAMQFVAYYTTGKGKRKQPSDWAAAWRNWLKQAVKYERQAEDRHAENGRTAGQRREVDGGAAGSGGEDEYVRQRGYSYDAIVGLGTTR